MLWRGIGDEGRCGEHREFRMRRFFWGESWVNQLIDGTPVAVQLTGFIVVEVAFCATVLGRARTSVAWQTALHVRDQHVIRLRALDRFHVTTDTGHGAM